MKTLCRNVKFLKYFFYTTLALILAYFFIHYFTQWIVPPNGISTPNDLAIKSIVYSDVIQYNIAYLALSVAFIFVLGGTFYFLNIKPLEKKLEDQDEKLINLESRVNEKILEQQNTYNTKFNEITDSLSKSKQIEERINSTEIRIKSAEERAEDIQLQIYWSQHYTWDNQRMFTSDMLCLISYLQLIVQIFKKTESKKINVKSALEQIKRVLERDPGNELGSVLKLTLPGKTPRDMVNKYFGDFMTLYQEIQIPELEKIKTEIRDLMIEKWYNGNNPTTSVVVPVIK